MKNNKSNNINNLTRTLMVVSSILLETLFIMSTNIFYLFLFAVMSIVYFVFMVYKKDFKTSYDVLLRFFIMLNVTLMNLQIYTNNNVIRNLFVLSSTFTLLLSLYSFKKQETYITYKNV